MKPRFVWILGLRGLEAEIWHGEITRDLRPLMPLQSYQLKDGEESLGIDKLMLLYPYKAISDGRVNRSTPAQAAAEAMLDDKTLTLEGAASKFQVTEESICTALGKKQVDERSKQASQEAATVPQHNSDGH